MATLVWKQFLYVSLLMVLVGPVWDPFFYHQILLSILQLRPGRCPADLHCVSRAIGRQRTCKMIFNLGVCRGILFTELHPDACCAITLRTVRC